MVAVAGNAVTFLVGRGDGTFQLGQTSPVSAAFRAVAGDLDGDGNVDVLVPDQQGRTMSDGALRVYFGDGAGAVRSWMTIYMPDPPGEIRLHDLDGDGRPDLALSSYNGPVLSVQGNSAVP
jgi:hypothetical protein